MKSKWLIGLLIASIGINLALIGFILGQRGPHLIVSDPARTFPRWARTLPDERRETLRPLLRNHRQNMWPAIRELRTQHQAIRNSLQATPFDANTLRDSLAEMRARNERVQRLAHQSLVEFVSELTDAERADLAEEMKRRPGQGNKPHANREHNSRLGADRPEAYPRP